MFRDRYLLSFITLLGLTNLVSGQAPTTAITEKVNQKLVKLYGAGGFQGLVSYGTGILISSQGHILTAATQMLDTRELRVHLYDGRRLQAKVLVIEPEFDAAILEISRDKKEKRDLNLPYFDLAAELKKPAPEIGEMVLAFTNAFKIADRDEPLSVQQGRISAHTKLTARRGITQIPFNGEVYFVDTILNNPGAAGGALTSSRGQLIGMIGKEYRNVVSDTWSNYAIPINCKVEIERNKQKKMLTLVDFCQEAVAGKWVSSSKNKTQAKKGPGGYHGIVFVPDVVEQTPPYIDRIEANSPAAKAGLKVDDLIVYVEGEPVYSIKSFNEMMSRTRPGTELRLEIRRGEKLTGLTIVLGDFPKSK